MRQIVLDTETTGLLTTEGHRIIEIGCIELINRQITGRHFHHYVHPQRDIDQAAMAVHGITVEFLQAKPIFKQIIAELLDFINKDELIIHNAAFDVEFLNYEFKLAGVQYGKIQDYSAIFDTLQFARKKHPGQQNSLDALCKRYNVDNSGRNLHGALLDANLLAEVYLAITGGQTSLFADNQPNSIQPQQVIKTVNQSPHVPLKIIYATNEELQEHEKYLSIINKSSGGACLWQVDETAKD